MAKIDANIIEMMINILKSPADTVAIAKGSNSEISVGTVTGITGLISSLSSVIATNPELKAGLNKLGLGASVVGLISDGRSLSENNYNDKTITSLLSNVSAVAAGIIAIGGSSVIASGLLVAGTGLALWSAYETTTDTDITDALNDFQTTLIDMKDTLGNSIDIFVNDINLATDLLQEQYNNFLNYSNETISYNDWIADTNNTINMDDFSLVGYLKELGVNNVTSNLNNQTKTLDLNTLTTVSGGYGDIINVKDSLGNDIFVVPDEYGNQSVYDNNGQLDVLQASTVLNTLNTNNLDNWSDMQHDLFDLKTDGSLGLDLYSDISKNISNYLIGDNSVYNGLTQNGIYLDIPKIGAFYESSTSQIDNSESIAQKTYKLLNSSNQTITKEQLNTLDVNHDGKLSGNEILNLKTWKDLNEDGIAQSGEITSLSETIYSKDYDLYTKGNSVFQTTTTPTQPSKQDSTNIIPSSDYSSITKSVSVPTVPNSNFDSLRANDNRYFYYANGYYGYIDWSSNQVKINNSNRSYLIGTNGNDSFDYRY